MYPLAKGLIYLSAFLATPGLSAPPESGQKTLGATRPVDEARQPDDKRTKTLGTTRPAKRPTALPALPRPGNNITIMPLVKPRTGKAPPIPAGFPPLIIPAEE